MKLRNKKTGEIKDLQYIVNEAYLEHNERSLLRLAEEWEDYKEPKESFWTIGKDGTPIEYTFDFDGKFYEECDNEWIDKIKEIGFYFETEEEAEKAVEKLKTWKRLRDNGFRFKGWMYSGLENRFIIDGCVENLNDFNEEMDLCFRR